MAPRRSWLVLLLDALLASCGRLVTVVTPCVSKGSSSRHLMAPGVVVFLTGTVPTLLFVEEFLDPARSSRGLRHDGFLP